MGPPMAVAAYTYLPVGRPLHRAFDPLYPSRAVAPVYSTGNDDGRSDGTGIDRDGRPGSESRTPYAVSVGSG